MEYRKEAQDQIQEKKKFNTINLNENYDIVEEIMVVDRNKKILKVINLYIKNKENGNETLKSSEIIE